MANTTATNATGGSRNCAAMMAITIGNTTVKIAMRNPISSSEPLPVYSSGSPPMVVSLQSWRRTIVRAQKRNKLGWGSEG